MNLMPDMLLRKETRAQGIEVYQTERSSPEGARGRCPQSRRRRSHLAGSDRSRRVRQFPFTVRFSQTADQFNEREFWDWCRSILSDELYVGKGVDCELGRTRWKSVRRKNVGENIEV